MAKTISDLSVNCIKVKIESSKKRIEEYRERVLSGLGKQYDWNRIWADNLIQQLQGIIEEQAKIKELNEVLEMLGVDNKAD